MCLGGWVRLPREVTGVHGLKGSIERGEGGKSIPGRGNSICKVLQGCEAGEVGWSQDMTLVGLTEKTGLDPGDKRKSKDLVWVKVPNEAHAIHGVCSYHASSPFPSIPISLNTP